jgi:hypothetical protein
MIISVEDVDATPYTHGPVSRSRKVVKVKTRRGKEITLLLLDDGNKFEIHLTKSAKLVIDDKGFLWAAGIRKLNSDESCVTLIE